MRKMNKESKNIFQSLGVGCSVSKGYNAVIYSICKMNFNLPRLTDKFVKTPCDVHFVGSID